MRKLLALAFVPAIALAGCGGSSDSTAASPAATSAAASPASTEAGSVTVDGVTVSGAEGQEPTVTVDSGATPPSELVVQEIYPGTGKAIKPNSVVTAQYVLVPWTSGEVLQSSWSAQALTFPVSGVIQGWQQGLQGVKQGARVLLIIPPELGYGESPQPGSGIEPNETLVFVVDVEDVQ